MKNNFVKKITVFLHGLFGCSINPNNAPNPSTKPNELRFLCSL